MLVSAMIFHTAIFFRKLWNLKKYIFFVFFWLNQRRSRERDNFQFPDCLIQKNIFRELMFEENVLRISVSHSVTIYFVFL